MIRRYVYGAMIETDAILLKPRRKTGLLPYFTVDNREQVFSYKMRNNDRVYDLGGNVLGINKRGWRYISRCRSTLRIDVPCTPPIIFL